MCTQTSLDWLRSTTIESKTETRSAMLSTWPTHTPSKYMWKNSTSPINSSKPISNQLRNSPQAHPTNRARIRSILSSRQIQIELFVIFCTKQISRLTLRKLLSSFDFQQATSSGFLSTSALSIPFLRPAQAWWILASFS